MIELWLAVLGGFVAFVLGVCTGIVAVGAFLNAMTKGGRWR